MLEISYTIDTAIDSTVLSTKRSNAVLIVLVFVDILFAFHFKK